MRTLHFEQLFDGQRWHTHGANVVIDAAGNIAALSPGAAEAGAEHVPGIALPGLPNLHSHAHQRAMAGLGERAGKVLPWVVGCGGRAKGSIAGAGDAVGWVGSLGLLAKGSWANGSGPAWS